MGKRTGMRPMRGLAIAVAMVAWGVSGCATPGAGSESWDEMVSWDDTLDFGVPTTVTQTVEGVTFYPACGNEVLHWDGENYYPYNPADIDDFPTPVTTALPDAPDEVAGASAVASTTTVRWARASSPLATVVAPEPGDDVGTLVVFEGGHAFWESSTGKLATWLTTRELDYNWVC